MGTGTSEAGVRGAAGAGETGPSHQAAGWGAPEVATVVVSKLVAAGGKETAGGSGQDGEQETASRHRDTEPSAVLPRAFCCVPSRSHCMQ